ncbi:hypothetical protein OCH239_13065 [Roseivivax halodurans JCM 10272]|uniref:Uncharacterized protein n=1 Tax=Roseivivax halodurans JCM 10272 TaxID=1449350 RepID=X7EDE8_9RHOB|nr:hypothetical protein OCH239_13065 [Roseivivax halodurans JCM 10272]
MFLVEGMKTLIRGDSVVSLTCDHGTFAGCLCCPLRRLGMPVMQRRNAGCAVLNEPHSLKERLQIVFSQDSALLPQFWMPSTSRTTCG